MFRLFEFTEEERALAIVLTILVGFNGLAKGLSRKPITQTLEKVAAGRFEQKWQGYEYNTPYRDVNGDGIEDKVVERRPILFGESVGHGKFEGFQVLYGREFIGRMVYSLDDPLLKP